MANQVCKQCGAKLKPKATFCASCGAPVRGAASRSQGPQRGGRRRQTQRTGLSGAPVILLAVAGAVLVLLAGVLLANNMTQPAAAPAAAPAPLAVATQAPVAANSNQRQIPNPEVPRVAPAEARAQVDAGKAVLVDVRSPEEYASAHAAGALSLPLANIEQRYQEVPRNQEIITYCTWPSEETSARAARILMDKGFTNVKALLGGFNSWKSAGYPVATGQ